MDIDGVKANMALDSGAFATIMTRGFMEDYKDAKGYSFNSNRAGGSKGGTVNASFSESLIPLRKRRLAHVGVGSFTLSPAEVLYPEDKTPGLLATRRFSGLLGYNFLKNFVIYLVYYPTPYVIFERI